MASVNDVPRRFPVTIRGTASVNDVFCSISISVGVSVCLSRSSSESLSPRGRCRVCYRCSFYWKERSLFGGNRRKQRGHQKQDPQIRFPSSLGLTDTVVCLEWGMQTRSRLGIRSGNHRATAFPERVSTSFGEQRHSTLLSQRHRTTMFPESLRISFGERRCSILMSLSASRRKQWGHCK